MLSSTPSQSFRSFRECGADVEMRYSYFPYFFFFVIESVLQVAYSQILVFSFTGDF